jgi:hypothetical protein
MRLEHRGGRRLIAAPEGSELAPATKPRPDGTLVKALARAWRWQRMLDEGLCHRQRARRRREYLEELRKPDLRLALLAPDIIESISRGRRIRHYCWRVWSDRCHRAGRNKPSISVGEPERREYALCRFHTLPFRDAELSGGGPDQLVGDQTLSWDGLIPPFWRSL